MSSSSAAISNQLPRRLEAQTPSSRVLQRAASLWFLTAVAGQWLFVYYISAFYGIAFHRWNGRIFMLAAIGAALGGLYLEWVRGTGLRAKAAAPPAQYAMAASLVILTVVMGVGEIYTFFLKWGPLLSL